MSDPNAQVDLTENHNGQIIAVVVVFCTLSTTAVLLRLWSRLTNAGIKTDDIILVASQICVLGWNMMLVSSIRWAGTGYHVLSLSGDQILNFKKMFFASNFVQPTALALAKISMLVLLRRIFPSRAFRWTVYLLSFVVVAWWIAGIVGELTVCTPINSYWNADVTPYCVGQDLFIKGLPIPWIVTDIAILIAPLPVLKQLQLPRAQKWGLIGLFMVGILTCIVSIVRYSTLWYSMEDVTFEVVPAALWGVVETNITSFCAAIIACRSVLSFLYPEKFIRSISERYFPFMSTSSRSRSGYKRSKDQGPSQYGMDTPLRDVSKPATGRSIQVTSEMEVNYSDAKR